VLRPEIKTALDLRSRKVCIAFDADAATNPDVRHAMVRLYLLLTAAGADVYQLTSWDLDKGKGIDDYLVRQALAGKNGTRPTDALRMLIDDAAPFCDTLRPTPYDLQIVARELGRVQLPPALRDQLCKSLAKQLKVSVEELRTAASQHQSALPEEQDGVTGALDKLNIWFDPDRNCFWRPNNRAMWIKGSHGDVELLLRHEGWSEAKPKGGGLSDVQLLLSHIQSGRDVQYAGALAGHRKGQIYCGDNRILVVKGPLLIEPREIPWPILTKFLCGLLGLGQLRYLHGWLKVALESLYQGRIRPGQALVMAGPRDCGKSLLQSLITQMLGGRMARPYAYMAALTPFNGHLFEAEHLPIEDEQPYTDIRARRNFGVKIKEITGIEVQNCHAKYRPAISLPVFWRLSISTNDERENLMILPPLDDSLQDKLIIFKAQCCPMPMPTATIAERQLFWDTLVSELPGYIHYLFNRWVIEEQLVSQRYGITHFHHSEIVSHLQELAPEMRLLELIDAEVFKYVEPIGRRTDPWKGSSMELEKVLTDSTSSVSFQARQLLCWQGACGTYLRRLKNLFPTRITFTTPHGVHRWTIESPKN
jgi:hypothetical protein